MNDQQMRDFLEFLSIPSVSALPEHRADIDRAARWLRDRMAKAGLSGCVVLETPVHPVVFGEAPASGGSPKPTVMVYAHYDTQPADPLDEWKTPPFEPSVRGGRIYARGATDNKGGAFPAILAVEDLIRSRNVPVNLKFVFEGEEEIGSPGFHELILSRPDIFACDVILSLDGGMYSRELPSICTGCRGIASLDISVKGPSTDVHSGGFGGLINNPLQALAEIIAGLKDKEGKVAVRGFYDDVVQLSEEEKAEFERVPFDAGEAARSLGVPEPFGEAGFAPLERMWVRPTLDVNGMWGGFQGQGSKTIIPSEANCKVTCRLVPDQDPGKICTLLDAHIRAHAPKGVTVRTSLYPGDARPYVVPIGHPAVMALRDVLREFYGVEPIVTRAGGSLPIAGTLAETLGAPVLLFGMGSPDSNVHGPNESLAIEDFDRLQRILPPLWARLSQVK